MQARIEIPAKQNASWGAVYALLLREHREDWRFHWRATEGRDGESAMVIEGPGEDVDGMRAEIDEAVEIVNGVARNDPSGQMVEIDAGLVDVLVD